MVAALAFVGGVAVGYLFKNQIAALLAKVGIGGTSA